MNKSLYTNIAFISYKHEDEAWAKWLQKKLQYYKLPVDICKKHPNLEFSECPRHVFKDTTDLSGGVLAKAIKAGLDSSKFLIVICSPRAAKSEWVCKEVQEFIDSGREEYIIPFIIEGEPHAKNKENECFPSTLKSLAGERELLGINVNENGREAASVKVAARMFGLSYDSLWQRFKREEKKKRRNIIATFITAIIILLSIIAYGIWANRRITEERDKANIANNQLFAANKRITKQKGKLQEANDSILKQKSALQQAFNNLAKTEHALTQSNNDLKEKNYQLKIERDNVLKANWGMQENQARAVSEKAKELISNGNVLKGAYLSLSVLPKDRNSTIRPFVINAEQALRSAYDSLVYGKKSFALLEQNGQVLHTSFSEDSKYILTTSNDGKIRIWETCTGQETNFISPYFGQSILSAYFVGSDKIISFLYDGSVYLINIKTGIKKHINISGTNPVFSNNKKKFALSQNKDNIIKIFNTDTWETIDKIQANTLTFSPIDNKIAYVNNGEVIIKDGNIIINRWKCINSRIVYSLQYSPDGRSLLICTNDSLSLWDIESTAKISSYTEEGGFNGAIYTKDGKHIVTQSESGKVLFFHKNNFKRPFYMFQYPSSVEKIDFSPNNEYFSEFNFKEGFVSLYKNPISQKNNTNIDNLYSSEDNIYICSNGYNFIKIDGDRIKLHNMSGSIMKIYPNPFTKKVKSKNGHYYVLNMTNGINYSSKTGDMAIISKEDKKIHLINALNPKDNYVLPITSQMFSCAFSNDGHFLAVGCRNKIIYIWNIFNKQMHAVLYGHKLGVTSLAFSNDNKTLISSSYDNTIRFWNIENRKEKYYYDASNYDIKSVAFNYWGSHYAFADEEGIHIKDLNTKHEIYTIQIKDAKQINFSNKDSYMYIMRGNYDDEKYDGNHFVRIVLPKYNDIYHYFNNLLKNFNLTKEEKRRFFLE